MVDLTDLKKEISGIINGGKGKTKKGVKKNAKNPVKKEKNSKSKSKSKKPIGFMWEYRNDNGKISKNIQMIYNTQTANKMLGKFPALL